MSPMSQPRAWLAHTLTSAERAVDRRIGAILRQRPGWGLTVLPYVGHGTTTQLHVRGRVVARRRQPHQHRGPATVLLTAMGHYLSAEVAGAQLTVEVGGRQLRAVSDDEGYVEVEFDVALSRGWHPVTFRIDGEKTVVGKALVVDPAARLGLVSDIDDTIIHTGLTRLAEAIRTTLLVAEDARVAIPGAPELYAGLVAADDSRSPVFYVSTGAWNLHTVLERFLDRHAFPVGPMLMTDWGPGGKWLFREDSISFKSRTILERIDEHPQLRWVLVGDSGQHDPEAYVAVARARPGRLHAIYIREVPPQSPGRRQRVRELAEELETLGVPMLLITDSIAAAEHACELGLLEAAHVEQVRLAVPR